MTLFEFLLIVHILAALLLTAAAGISTACGLLLGRTDDPRMALTLLTTQKTTEMFVTTPAAILSIVFGTWLVDEGGFEFSEAWISVAYLLWIIAMGTAHGFLLPRARRAARAAAALVERGQSSIAGSIPELTSPASPLAGTALNLLFVVFVVLMVLKPGA